MRRNVKTGVHAVSGLELTVFSDDEIRSVHEATLEVLQETGLRVEGDEALEIFHGGGAQVERSNEYGLVKIPPYVVEDCIRWAPSTVVYHGRDPDNDFVAEPKRVGLINGGGCVNVIDPVTKARHKSTKKDCGDIARVCDALDEIAVFERPCVASDVTPAAYPVHCLEVILQNTTKHVLLGADNARNLRAMIEVAAAALGGMETFKRRPIFEASACPTTPLSLLHDCTDVVVEAARQGVGLGINTMALAGATSAATLASTLVTTNAEVLGALVLAQLTTRGARCTFSSTSTIMDMGTGIGSVGAPEIGLISSAMAKLAQYYRLPCWVAGGMSDSKIPDAQAAYETVLTALPPALAGANLVYGAGGLDQLLTFDLAKLLMDVELIGMIMKVVKGIDVTDQTLALDVIHELGPGGEFLTHDHTYAHVRALSQGRLFDRTVRDVWLAAGGKDLTERAYERARYLLEHHTPKPLPKGAAETIHEVVEAYEAELGVGKT